MRITEKKLIEVGCCQSGVDKYFSDIGRKSWDAEKLVDKCLGNDDFGDGAYAISKLMTKMQRVKWAIYCAEQVIGIYEEKYPDNDAPRKAIEAAKQYLKTPTADAANAAADAAAYAAAYAAYAAADAANAAAYAANAAYAAANAAYAAAYAAYAAYAANAAAYAAANAAANAAYASRANNKLKAKPFKQGLKILLTYKR